MIYGYLADTALAPLSPNNTTYELYSSSGAGVGQVTERVLSMLNTDIKAATAPDAAPGLIIDPRTNNTNMRRTGCFDGPSIPAQMRAAGVMSIHYDRYLAYDDAEMSPDQVGNYIDQVTKQDELKILFTVIETITMSHVYDTNSQIWEYRTKEWLNNRLSSYSSTNLGSYGYIADSLELAVMSGSEKTAKVRNVTSGSTEVVDTLGDDEQASVAEVYFPGVITFSFRFSELDGPTAFRLYLDPESMLNKYDRTTITHVVMPMAPEDLCDPTKISEMTKLGILDFASSYVANMISGVDDDDDVSAHDYVYNSDILKGTNYTGSVARSVGYLDGTNSIKFACIYKGSTPTTFRCLKEIYNALLKRLTSDIPGCRMTEEDANDLILETFPSILSAEQYTIIPFYDSIVTSNVSNSYTYARNVFSLAYLNRLLRKAQSNVPNSDAYTTLITIPGYDMHGIAISSEDTTDAGTAPLISEYGLDNNDDFNSYQPLSSVDTRWNTMTTESKLLAEYLSAIVGAEVNGTAISVSSRLSYTPETVKLGGERYACIVFTVGSATFYVMKKNAYDKFISNEGE